MLPIVSQTVYKSVEQESHSDPYGFIDQVSARIRSRNPEIFALVERWVNQYENEDWVAPSIGYACVVYRMLELSMEQPPIVMRKTAKPLGREFWKNANGPGCYFRDQLQRLLAQNRYVAMAAVWSTFDAIVQNNKRAMTFIPILGLAVYRYLEKEAELDRSPKSTGSLS